MITVLKDLIQSEKEISRPSQEEAGFKALSESGVTCASCRWFKSEDGAYCHLIQNAPLDVSDASTCDRHEADSVTEPEVKEIDFIETVPVEVAIVETVPEPVTVLMEAKSDDKSLLAGILDRVDAKLRTVLNRDPDPLTTSFKVAGNHWFIVWSNNFRDKEGEIFTAKAMDDYVARVDQGIVPPPDLVVWHLGLNTKMGKADWVARHGHFLVAAGEFDPSEQAQRAKAYYQRHAKKTAVSHGYTYPANSFDGKHYHAFNTFEISLLPRGKEANRYTSLERIKQMTITPEKEKYVREVFGEDLLAPVKGLGDTLEQMGVEFKDFTAVPAEDAAPVDTATVEADVKALVSENTADLAEVAKWTLAIGKAFKDNKEAFDARLDDLTTAFTQKFEAQAKEIAALKDQLDSRPKSASKAEETELDVAKLQAISAQADRQQAVKDSFWQTTYVPAAG